LKIPNEENIDSSHCNDYNSDIRELKDRNDGHMKKKDDDGDSKTNYIEYVDLETELQAKDFVYNKPKMKENGL
jgi:hypothetical protein